MINKKHLVSIVNCVLLLICATRAPGQEFASGFPPELPLSAYDSEAGQSPIETISGVAPHATGLPGAGCGQQLCSPGTRVCDPSAVFGNTSCECGNSGCGCVDSAVLIGAEFLLVRPHFSEAIAFARGRQTLTGFNSSARELDFDYEPSFRTRLGYRFEGTGQTVMLTYWNFDGDVDVSGRPSPGEFFVDPFGNTAGLGNNPNFVTILPSGDAIRTRARVEMNVLDADAILPLVQRGRVKVLGIAGVRVAWVDQSYESVVTLGGDAFARGDFSVDFTGAGPHLGSHLVYALTQDGSLSAYARGTGSLLVGEYDVNFSNTTTLPAPFRAAQRTSVSRAVPVLDAELGVDWRVLPNLKLSAGWMFQSWFDLGTSGGTFGGFFNGADDSNIMSFDGLTLGAELSF
jgi:hypothetical protein